MKTTLTKRLLEWYAKEKRDLPWRRSSDPYAVLVSEMMLQQTQVKTVIGYYRRFLACFPDFAALAAAPEQEVMAVWQGLGYYSRARSLHRLAKRVVAEHGGSLPRDPDALIDLPGVGPYVCGAVMSIAFGVPTPAVDGNVLRVTARVEGIFEDVAKPKTRMRVTETVRGWMAADDARGFTQALMELGSLVCRPKKPECEVCPISQDCFAFQNGQTEALPRKAPKPKPVKIAYDVLVIAAENAVLMQYREKGLLAGMWGLPMAEKTGGGGAEGWMHEHFPKAGAEPEFLGKASHTFSHRKWEMDVIGYRLNHRIKTGEGVWQPVSNLDELPVPAAFWRALRLLPELSGKKPG